MCVLADGNARPATSYGHKGGRSRSCVRRRGRCCFRGQAISCAACNNARQPRSVRPHICSRALGPRTPSTLATRRPAGARPVSSWAGAASCPGRVLPELRRRRVDDACCMLLLDWKARYVRTAPLAPAMTFYVFGHLHACSACVLARLGSSSLLLLAKRSMHTWLLVTRTRTVSYVHGQLPARAGLIWTHIVAHACMHVM